MPIPTAKKLNIAQEESSGTATSNATSLMLMKPVEPWRLVTSSITIWPTESVRSKICGGLCCDALKEPTYVRKEVLASLVKTLKVFMASLSLVFHKAS